VQIAFHVNHTLTNQSEKSTTIQSKDLSPVCCSTFSNQLTWQSSPLVVLAKNPLSDRFTAPQTRVERFNDRKLIRSGVRYLGVDGDSAAVDQDEYGWLAHGEDLGGKLTLRAAVSSSGGGGGVCVCVCVVVCGGGEQRWWRLWWW
jgi:hypothetical protein